jgi:hypothetical protein
MKISLLYLSLLLMRKKSHFEAEREKLQSIRHQTRSHLKEQMQERSRILHFDLCNPIHYIFIIEEYP